MKELEPVILIAAAVLIAAGSSIITAAYLHRKFRCLYNRGWTAGREFTVRKLHDQISR